MSQQENKPECKILKFPEPKPQLLATIGNLCDSGEFYSNISSSIVRSGSTIPVVSGDVEFSVDVEHFKGLDMDELLEKASMAFAPTRPEIAEKFLLLKKMIKGDSDVGE